METTSAIIPAGCKKATTIFFTETKDTLETAGLRTPRQIAQRGRKMSSKKEKHNNDCSNFLEGITQ